MKVGMGGEKLAVDEMAGMEFRAVRHAEAAERASGPDASLVKASPESTLEIVD